MTDDRIEELFRQSDERFEQRFQQFEQRFQQSEERSEQRFQQFEQRFQQSEERSEQRFQQFEQRFQQSEERSEALFRETWNQMKALSSTLNARIDGVAKDLAEVKSEVHLVRADQQELRILTKGIVLELAAMKIELGGTRLAYSALNEELVNVKTGIDAFKTYVEVSLREVRDALRAGPSRE